MALNDPPLTIGIEEEYLFVDLETRNLAVDPPATMMADCEARLTGQVSPEFLRAQIEVETRVCTSVAEARADLAHLRSTVADVANNHGMGLIAAATHPFAKWNEQQHTDKERYNELAQDMQALARRLLICGLHVHVGIEDDDLRIDLMNQVRYFLPHLLALSTSSPFWGGEDSGLLSYRLSVFDAMPRSGLPDVFDSASEYDRLVAQMVNANVIEDATKFWWDVRPSARYPTLEMRITDVCTRLDDSIAIAALYVCILSMLYRLRKSNQRWRVYPRTMINENRWLAQRYGVTGNMVDFGIGQPVAYADLLEEVIELVREDAERMECVAEIEHAREIVRRGTSAQLQQQVYQQALSDGASNEDALKSVVDMLIKETTVGL
jgi:glutamate---cysteine ligase / carboxylate-amine ligase